MNIKQIITLVSSATNKLQNTTSTLVNESIKNEVTHLAFKVILGIIIASVVIFSLIQLGFAYLVWLSQFDYENYMQLISFGFLSLTGVIGLFILFRAPKPAPKNEQLSVTKNDLLDLVLSLASGIIEGYLEKNKQSNEASKENFHNSSEKSHH